MTHEYVQCAMLFFICATAVIIAAIGSENSKNKRRNIR
jgi:hypothetical protein